jgi:hypothetical protein
MISSIREKRVGEIQVVHRIIGDLVESKKPESILPPQCSYGITKVK